MKSVILFREDSQNREEFQIASKYFDVFRYRSEIPNNTLVIPRYSSLPFYNELEKDVEVIGSKLINSYKEHKWIADFEYYEILKDYTFKTWFRLEDLPDKKSFVVKGRTNSRKQYWNTKMFAKDKQRAMEIFFDLGQDDLINEQGIIFREYEPLVTYEIGINGLPFTNEWRFFFYKNEILSYNYYWSIAENTDRKLDIDGFLFAKEVAEICSNYVNFFVIDIAQKEDGNWILIEVNDGTMSGLSCNDPGVLYNNLKIRIK